MLSKTPIIEPFAVPDIFANGMLPPEDLGYGTTRFTFYVKRRSLIDATSEGEIVCRLVVPSAISRANMLMTMQALGIAESCGKCDLFKGCEGRGN